MASVDETIELLKSKFRSPIVAEIGGFRPPDDPRSSWFGAGCAYPGEKLPFADGSEMFPLLQINCTELPRSVKAFGNTKLLVVYFSNLEIPFDQPHGKGWEIREYSTLDNLIPVKTPRPEYLKPFPIRWHEGEPERPSWEESWNYLDMSPINKSEEASSAFFDFPHCYNTKIGGYPSEIQHGIVHSEDFVFQIGSEEKSQFKWVDNGIAYFSRARNGQWKFEVQFS